MRGPIVLGAALVLGGCGGEGVNSGFVGYEPIPTVVLKTRDGVDSPRDLQFHPSRKGELWIMNYGTEDSGSEMLIVTDPGGDNQDVDARRDENAWHFMNTSTALAFSDDNDNFATSPAITDANHSGGTFTGPSLWSSDLDVFAMPSGGNGSHIDMLHGSPNAMGIAHETRNVFWLFDGYNEEIVRYDFGGDHGPGNADHDDGKVHRFSSLEISRRPKVSSHMVLDKDTDWLYICDTGNSRVLRMDIESGSKESDLPLVNETLAHHWQMSGEVWEVFASEGLEKPSGVALDEGILYVSDFDTGEIIAYDVESGLEVSRMQTEARGIMGLEIGPDGNLWYVDSKGDTVVRIDKG